MLLPYKIENRIEAGCDEAGRGCLAGAVFAAAVILPPGFRNETLNDSKQLTERQRYALRPLIEKEALAWAVGVVSPQEIDEMNILKASFLAMHRAIDALRVRPEALLIDGNRFTPYRDLPYSCEVKTRATPPAPIVPPSPNTDPLPTTVARSTSWAWNSTRCLSNPARNPS